MPVRTWKRIVRHVGVVGDRVVKRLSPSVVRAMPMCRRARGEDRRRKSRPERIAVRAWTTVMGMMRRPDCSGVARRADWKYSGR